MKDPENICVKYKYQFIKPIYDYKKVIELFDTCEEYVRETISNSKYIRGDRYGGNAGDSLYELHEINGSYFSWELQSDGHLFILEIMCNDTLNNDDEFKKNTKLIKNKINLLLREYDDKFVEPLITQKN